MAFPLVNIRGHSNKSKLFFFCLLVKFFPLGGHLVCVQCLEAIGTYVLYTVYILSTTSGRDRCSSIAIHSRFFLGLSPGFRRLPFLTSRQRRTRGELLHDVHHRTRNFLTQPAASSYIFGVFSPVLLQNRIERGKFK